MARVLGRLEVEIRKKEKTPSADSWGKKVRTVAHTLLSTQSSACKSRSDAARKLNVKGHLQTAQLRGKCGDHAGPVSNCVAVRERGDQEAPLSDCVAVREVGGSLQLYWPLPLQPHHLSQRVIVHTRGS